MMKDIKYMKKNHYFNKFNIYDMHNPLLLNTILT